MNGLLKTGGESLRAFLRTRTGFLGLGPTYGEILAGYLLNGVLTKFEERSVVRGAEKFLAEINERDKML